jgi:orotate phosphoribosyltransferase-like protein
MFPGRPCLDVTSSMMREVEQLAEEGLSRDEIAGELNISRKTLSKHFAGVIADGRERRKAALAEDQAVVRLLRLSESRNRRVALDAAITLLRTEFGW